MKSRIKVVLLSAFGTLLVLMGVLALNAFWRAERIYTEVSTIHEANRRGAAILDEIHTDVFLASLVTRDYLLDPRANATAKYRSDLQSLRAATMYHLEELATFMDDDGGPMIDRLRGELEAYWKARLPVFDWTADQKAQRALTFLAQESIPHRQAILFLTEEIKALNTTSLQKERDNLKANQSDFRRYVGGLFAIALILALVVAGVSYSHISTLEHQAKEERRRIEQAEQELRHLSQKLVQAQEEERKSLSRELHDAIGQMLTGLLLELRNLEELRTAPDAEFAVRLAETKVLAEQALRSVRDLAMGLRPSMLDDLGLAPALQWQAREFSRLIGIPAVVKIDGDIDHMSEDVRTCAYRVVQESLTNCARHARAKNVQITLHGGKSDLTISIQDDGIGFSHGAGAPRGIGLVGMEERVRELGGRLRIFSQPNKGTLLDINIPLIQRQAL